jgi:hypothetical protein
MTDKELADWWEEADLIQEAVYSGYVKAHGIKLLSGLLPNGITGYLFGHISGRIVVLNISWVNIQLLLLQDEVTQALAQGEDAVYFALFTHSIFPYHLCITYCHQPSLGGVLPERLKSQNLTMDSVRTSIEWTYGDIIVLFHVFYSKYDKEYFLLDCKINEVLHQQLCDVFFVYNCYVCFNGNKLMLFFDMPPPNLVLT